MQVQKDLHVLSSSVSLLVIFRLIVDLLQTLNHEIEDSHLSPYG